MIEAEVGMEAPLRARRSGPGRRWPADLGRPAAAAGFAVALGLMSGDNGFWLTVITSSAILFVLVAAYNIIFGYAGLFNLAHVAIYGIGAYASVLFESELGVSFWLSVPMAMCVTLVASLLVALPTSRLGGAFFALGTLAFGIRIILTIFFASVLSFFIALHGLPEDLDLPLAVALFVLGVLDASRPQGRRYTLQPTAQHLRPSWPSL